MRHYEIFIDCFFYVLAFGKRCQLIFCFILSYFCFVFFSGFVIVVTAFTVVVIVVVLTGDIFRVVISIYTVGKSLRPMIPRRLETLG